MRDQFDLNEAREIYNESKFHLKKIDKTVKKILLKKRSFLDCVVGLKMATIILFILICKTFLYDFVKIMQLMKNYCQYIYEILNQHYKTNEDQNNKIFLIYYIHTV